MFTAALAPHESLSGWVHVREGGGLLASWRRRHARIHGGATLGLYADEAAGEEGRRATLPLAGAELLIDEDEPLLLRLRTCAEGPQPRASSRPVALRIPTHDEAELWAWAVYQCAHGAAHRAEAAREVPIGVTPLAGPPRWTRRSRRGGGAAAGGGGDPARAAQVDAQREANAPVEVL